MVTRVSRPSLPGLLALLPLLIVTPAAATAPPGSDRVVFDLVERFPAAAVRADTTLIKFTDPETAPLLIAGFGTSRGGTLGAPFLWGTGDRSELRFFVSTVRRLALTFRCWPLRFKDAPQQRITVEVNGHDVGTVALRLQPSRYGLTIPARALRVGENRLVLRYAFSRSRKELAPASHDTRQLAVAWDWLQFGDRALVTLPSVTRDGGRSSLILPAGTQVDYYADVAAGSVLAIEDVRAAGAGSERADLQVEMQAATSARPTALKVPRSGPRVVPLPLSRGEIVKLSLRSVTSGARGDGAGGLELVRPTIRAPATHAPGTSGALALPIAKGKPPNIVIYLIDTLRADHLGCFGYGKPTSPHIDGFIRDATLFANAVAQSSATRPAVASIFTGLDPRRHGVSGKERALPPAAVTLAELLRDMGYETAGFVTNANVAPALGFAQGFETYEHLEEQATPEVHQLSDRLNERAFDWLGRRRGDKPFFLYLHATDPHAPYSPRSPYRERFAAGISAQTATLSRQPLAEWPASARDDLVALYDAEIAFNDAAFGELLTKLTTLGLYDSTLIVLVADHGEEFQDHGGWQHAKTLYREVLHVPLVIRVPGGIGAGKIVTQVVQQVDILPTILAYLQRPEPPSLEGRSLLSVIDGTPSDVEERVPAFSALGASTRFESVVTDRFKLIRDAYQVPGLHVYDLESDPQESRDIATEQPIIAEYLYSLVRRSRPAPEERLPRQTAELGEQTKERLRALGYLR